MKAENGDVSHDDMEKVKELFEYEMTEVRLKLKNEFAHYNGKEDFQFPNFDIVQANNDDSIKSLHISLSKRNDAPEFMSKRIEANIVSANMDYAVSVEIPCQKLLNHDIATPVCQEKRFEMPNTPMKPSRFLQTRISEEEVQRLEEAVKKELSHEFMAIGSSKDFPQKKFAVAKKDPSVINNVKIFPKDHSVPAISRPNLQLPSATTLSLKSFFVPVKAGLACSIVYDSKKNVPNDSSSEKDANGQQSPLSDIGQSFKVRGIKYELRSTSEENTKEKKATVLEQCLKRSSSLHASRIEKEQKILSEMGIKDLDITALEANSDNENKFSFLPQSIPYKGEKGISLPNAYTIDIPSNTCIPNKALLPGKISKKASGAEPPKFECKDFAKEIELLVNSVTDNI